MSSRLASPSRWATSAVTDATFPTAKTSTSLPDSQYSQGSALTAAGTTTNPYAGLGNFGTGKVALYQTLLPFPQYQAITDSISNGRSDFNALDVKVQKRFSRGMTLLTGYTWSSNWDNIWGAYGSSNTLNPGNNGPQDIYNISKEYARATNDIPNRFTLAGTYELPFGHGKQFLSGVNRLVDLAVGGWKFNDIMIVQNGGPLAVTQTNANSALGNSAQRPTLIPGVNPCYSGRAGGSSGALLQPGSLHHHAAVLLRQPASRHLLQGSRLHQHRPLFQQELQGHRARQH